MEGEALRYVGVGVVATQVPHRYPRPRPPRPASLTPQGPSPSDPPRPLTDPPGPPLGSDASDPWASAAPPRPLLSSHVSTPGPGRFLGCQVSRPRSPLPDLTPGHAGLTPQKTSFSLHRYQ